jgi:hypothetical protein
VGSTPSGTPRKIPPSLSVSKGNARRHIPIRKEFNAMIRAYKLTTLLPVIAVTLWTGSAVGLSAGAAADDTPPPATAPGNDASGRHHNPAWAACKKQADDQKLQPGDARRDFMKNCVKSAHGSAPAAQ